MKVLVDQPSSACHFIFAVAVDPAARQSNRSNWTPIGLNWTAIRKRLDTHSGFDWTPFPVSTGETPLRRSSEPAPPTSSSAAGGADGACRRSGAGGAVSFLGEIQGGGGAVGAGTGRGVCGEVTAASLQFSRRLSLPCIPSRSTRPAA